MRRTWERSVSSLLAGALAAMLAGCASVAVHRIDPKTGNPEAGTAEGLRFYLPRPYVSVFEPFVIASDAYLAKGEISPDGNYVLLTQVPPALNDIVNGGLQNGAKQTMGALAIDASKVLARNEVSGAPQGAPVTEPAPAQEGASAAPGGQPAAGGTLNYKATNDNAAFAVTPQPRYFNILWLPDFDEQYVVNAKAGLGNAGVTINMGQGWSLQGLDAKSDNSALAKPLLDFYSGTLNALQKLATAKIQAPLAALGGGPQAAAVAPTAKEQFKGGTPVTVKITKVRVVAPGLYPILKPGEAAALQLSADEQKRILVPKPPLTNIAFNTYEVIVVEAARPTGDTALRIQQYVDTGVQPSAAQSPAPQSKGDPLNTATSKLNAELSKPENVTRQGEYYLAKLTQDGTAIKVVLRIRKDAAPGKLDALPGKPEIGKLVIDTLNKAGITVAESDITVAK
jgi:hypothetical protein